MLVGIERSGWLVFEKNMVEEILKKAFESAGKSYSPQQVAEILDQHADAINQVNQDQYFLRLAIVLIVFLWAATSFWFLLSSHKLKIRLIKLEK